MIQNIHTICPNSGILFHINSSCDDEYYQKVLNLIDFYDFCYLFPKRYNSFWGSGYLFNIYIEMMEWCIERNICDYVFLTHSNSILINTQLETNIYNYELYFSDCGPIGNSGGFVEHVQKDKIIQRYKNTGDGKIYVTSTDGAAMTLKVAADFIKELKPYFIVDAVNYPSEEYYLPTAFIKLKLKEKYKYLNTTLERWGDTIDYNIVFFQLKAENNEDYITQLILSGQENILSKLNLYSLKKIPRDFHNKSRTLIRNHFGYNNILYHALS